MDLSSSSMISFLIRSSIDTSHPSCLSFTFRICALSIVFPASFGSLCCVKFVCHSLYCKCVDSIFPHLLHFLSHFLKYFGSHCKLAFWTNYFFSQSSFFLWNFFLLCRLSHCTEISCLAPFFPVLFYHA
jgi:hypothetical protein